KRKSNNLIADDEGNIWLSTPNALLATAGEKLQRLPLYDKELFETIHSVMSDHQDNIWVSTSGGLIRYHNDNEPFTTKKFMIAGLDRKTNITSLYQDANHHIW